MTDRYLHTMVDGVCEECGLTEPITYGSECTARLRAEVERLRALRCWCCGGTPSRGGHTPDCALAAALEVADAEA